jgi:hypothetical protein
LGTKSAIPKLDLGVTSKDAFEGFLNGKSGFSRKAPSDTSIAAGLPLQQGWNHFLVHLVHGHGDDIFSAAHLQRSELSQCAAFYFARAMIKICCREMHLAGGWVAALRQHHSKGTMEISKRPALRSGNQA